MEVVVVQLARLEEVQHQVVEEKVVEHHQEAWMQVALDQMQEMVDVEVVFVLRSVVVAVVVVTFTTERKTSVAADSEIQPLTYSHIGGRGTSGGVPLMHVIHTP